MLGLSPGSAVFGRDMLFDIPYLSDWADIGRRRQEQVDKSTVLEKIKIRLGPQGRRQSSHCQERYYPQSRGSEQRTLHYYSSTY